MRSRVERRAVLVGVAALFAAPLLVLAVRAAADVWRAPAIVPQEIGTRGLAYVGSGAARTLESLWNSLVVGVAATAAALLAGWPAARSLARSTGRARVALGVALATPLVVPQFAVGTGLTEWFLRLGLTDTLPGLVLAHLVYVLPYVVLLLAPAFGRRVHELEEAADVLGAGRLRRTVLVTVPAVAPALATAALLGFLVSWAQYGTSLAVGGGLPMLPVTLLPFVGSDPQVAASLSLVFVAPALVALVAAVALGREAARRGPGPGRDTR